MKKKALLIVLVIVIASFTVACSGTKAIEAAIVETAAAQNVAATEATPTAQPTNRPAPQMFSSRPGISSSYILVRCHPTGAIGETYYVTSLIFQGYEVCGWDLGTVSPWDRQMDHLYFVPTNDNCPHLDPRNAVHWELGRNIGHIFFEGEEIDQIPVYSVVGSNPPNLLSKTDE